MPDPLSIATAALQVVTTAAKLGKDVYSLVKGIKNAPANINVFVRDLQGLYLVLASLQFLVAKEATKDEHDEITGFMLENLEDLLGNTVQVLKDAQIIVGKMYRAIDEQGIWTGFKWETGKKDEVLAVQVSLQAYKLTLNLACSALTSVAASSTKEISTSMLAEIRQLRRQLAPADTTTLLNQKEDFEQNLENSAAPRVAYSIPLLRYLEETETVLSSSPRTSRTLSMTDLRSWSGSIPEVYKTTSRILMPKGPRHNHARENASVLRKPVGGLQQYPISGPSNHRSDESLFAPILFATPPKRDYSLTFGPPVNPDISKNVDLHSLERYMRPLEPRPGLSRFDTLSSDGSRSISAPFDFKHVAHIDHKGFIDLDQLDDDRFAKSYQLILATAEAALAKRRRPASAVI